MSRRFGLLFGKGREEGFTLIELLIVVLIVGILAAIAAPLYLGYVRDAKAAEAKGIGGSLWTAVQANAVANCGNTTAVSTGYAKAGFSSGGAFPATGTARWNDSLAGAPTITVDCSTGVITASSPTVFDVTGAGSDVTGIVAQLVYVGTASPPSRFVCQTTSGGAIQDPC